MTAAGSAGEAVTPGQAAGEQPLSDYLRERGRPWAADMIERAEAAARAVTPGQALNEILVARAWTIGRWETLAPIDRAAMETMARDIRAAIAAQQPQTASGDANRLALENIRVAAENRTLREALADAQPAPELPVVMRMTPDDVLIVAFALEFDAVRIVELSGKLREASGLQVIAVADVAAVRSWQPAPELAAAMRETAEVRDGYAKLCEEFSDSPQSGQSARISLTVLNRHRVRAGLEALKPGRTGLT